MGWSWEGVSGSNGVREGGGDRFVLFDLFGAYSHSGHHRCTGFGLDGADIAFGLKGKCFPGSKVQKLNRDATAERN